MKPLHPLFKWFGSKWSLAKRLPLPECDTIIEPFAGGAGYSLRHHEHFVTIAETDKHIHALWRWLIDDATESLIREIPINLTEGADIRTFGLSAGQATLVKSWQRTNNIGDCWTVSPWGNKPGQWTANTRARVSEEVAAIKHWRLAYDGFRLLEEGCEMEARASAATWLIDPPYEFNYQYRQDFDHTRLHHLARRLPGQIIACEAREPKTGRMPEWLPFRDFTRSITSRRAKGNHTHSSELIWTQSVKEYDLAKAERE